MEAVDAVCLPIQRRRYPFFYLYDAPEKKPPSTFAKVKEKLKAGTKKKAKVWTSSHRYVVLVLVSVISQRPRSQVTDHILSKKIVTKQVDEN